MRLRWMSSAALVLFLIGCAGAAAAQQQPSNSSGRAQDDTSRTCATCHADIVKQFRESAETHAGKGVTCASCHVIGNAHAEPGEAGAASGQKLDATAEENATCSQCHAEVTRTFTHEHPVIAAEGCVSCHAPHGSSNAAMLTTSNVNTQCQQCHLPSHANGGPRDAPAAGTAKSQTVQVASCTTCHTQIHGSDASEVFLK
jgi:predicted CXXCH cytochrome family protein